MSSTAIQLKREKIKQMLLNTEFSHFDTALYIAMTEFFQSVIVYGHIISRKYISLWGFFGGFFLTLQHINYYFCLNKLLICLLTVTKVAVKFRYGVGLMDLKYGYME